MVVHGSAASRALARVSWLALSCLRFETVMSFPGSGACQVRDQSQGGVPSGGKAPTYRGNDGSLVPAPFVAASLPALGRTTPPSRTTSLISMRSRRTSLQVGVIQPSLFSGTLTSRQLHAIRHLAANAGPSPGPFPDRVEPPLYAANRSMAPLSSIRLLNSCTSLVRGF